jgi:hypothetical protein
MNNQVDYKDQKKAGASSGKKDMGDSSMSKKGSIRAKIEALSAKIKSEGDNGETGRAIQEKAVAVILKGGNSKELKDYLSLFGFNESELKKLMPHTNARKDLALAYLVGNSPCGVGSTNTLILGVTDTLDKP